MEEKDINSLHANPKNPRKIDKHEYNALVRSIKTFGDLSGIVFNITTGQLVGGHQRVEVFKRIGGKPIIEERLPAPNSVGTIARGYVLLGDEKYTYREVDWPAEQMTDPENGTPLTNGDGSPKMHSPFEMAANIAANRIQGQFDNDKVAEIDYELSRLENGQELLDLSGQREDEVTSLLKSIGVGPEDPPPAEDEPDTLSFAVTREQREIIEEALENIKATREIASEKNSSRNGAALYYLSRDHLDRLHGLTGEPGEPPADVPVS